MEYFKLPPSTDLNEDELQKLLEEMIKDGYIYIKYNWKTENNEHPYSLTEKGKKIMK